MQEPQTVTTDKRFIKKMQAEHKKCYATYLNDFKNGIKDFALNNKGLPDTEEVKAAMEIITKNTHKFYSLEVYDYIQMTLESWTKYANKQFLSPKYHFSLQKFVKALWEKIVVDVNEFYEESKNEIKKSEECLKIEKQKLRKKEEGLSKDEQRLNREKHEVERIKEFYKERQNEIEEKEKIFKKVEQELGRKNEEFYKELDSLKIEIQAIEVMRQEIENEKQKLSILYSQGTKHISQPFGQFIKGTTENTIGKEKDDSLWRRGTTYAELDKRKNPLLVRN